MKEGDLTTEQQAEMIAEASGWRRRALVAEAALKVSRAETEKAARFAISRAAPATPPSPSCLGVVEALERIEALDEEELWGFPDRCTGDRPSFKTLDADTVKSIARTALQSHRGDER